MAPKKSKIPLVWVQSRGNRDGRPLFNNRELEDMGYVGNIDAQIHIGIAFHYLHKAFKEIKRSGDYSALTNDEWVETRQKIEDLCGLEDYYVIEEQTVERKKWGKR